MTLSAVLTATVELVADTLVNECGRPVPDRLLRYHGPNGLPQDACGDDGVLSITWSPGDVLNAGTPCPARTGYTLAIMYDVCWIGADVEGGGVTLHDAEWDADAAMLADTADCVARALLRVGCGPPREELAQAVWDASGTFTYRGVTPSIGGLAARLTWRAYSGVRSGEVVS